MTSHRMNIMTAGELRKALARVPDNAFVALIADQEGNSLAPLDRVELQDDAVYLYPNDQERMIP
jgi:hypothetical protein